MRSIFEAPDYILALWWDAQFASEWRAEDAYEKDKAIRAMKIVQATLNEKFPGLAKGDERYKNRSEQRKGLHPFSHVSPVAAGMTLLRLPGSRKGQVVAPDGAMSRDNIEAAIFLVHLANEVLAAMAVGEMMPAEWRAECNRTYSRVVEYLKGIDGVMHQ